MNVSVSACYREYVKSIDNAMLRALSKAYRQLPLDVGVRQYCLSYCRGQLNQAINPEGVNQSLLPIPKILQDCNALCFMTIYLKEKVFSCFLGQGTDLISAMNQTLQFSINEIMSKKSSIANEKWMISICFLFNEQQASSIRLGIHGISVSQENKIAFFKNSVPINNNFNYQKTLEKLSEKAGLKKNAYLEKNTQIRTYDSLEFIEDEAYQLCDLYRGNVLVLQSEVNETYLINALNSASNFIVKSLLPSGDIIHSVYSANGEFEIEKTPSAVTRNIASIWQLLVVAQGCELANYLDAAKKALVHIVANYFVRSPYLCVSGKTHLGMNSLLLMAILAVNDNHFLKKERALLICYIEKQISENKKYFLVTGDEALLYPAEAMLALMMLFENTSNYTYLKLCESLFPYYQALFYQTDKKSVMKSWLSKCCSKLFFATKKIGYAQFIFEMNDAILQYQIPAGFVDVDLVGGFSLAGDCRTTATLSESLLEAYRVAVALNAVERIEVYEKAILMALRFLLQLQVTSHRCQYPVALGGFKNSVFDNTIRIDNVQHVLCVLSGCRDVINSASTSAK